MIKKTTHDEPTVGNRIRDSFGYLFVSFLCSFAGYSIAAENHQTSRISILLLCYVAHLLPYFFSREVLLERKTPQINNSVKSEGVQVPLGLFVLISVLSLFILKDFFPPFIEFYLSSQIDILLAIALNIFPFIVLSVVSYQQLKNKQDDDAYGFVNRIIFPAIYACILPFTFGWAVSGDSIDLMLIGSVTLFVLALKAFDFVFKRSILFITIMFFVMVIIFVIAINILNIELFKVILYGMLITFSLGVSETAKRVYLAQTKDSYNPPNQNDEFLFAGANWSSIVFPILLAIIPLLTDELPLWPILTYILIQSIHWFSVKTINISEKTYIYSLLIGFMLPILLGTIPYTNLQPTLIEKENIYGLLTLVTLVIAFTGFLTKPTKDQLKLKLENVTFLHRDNRYLLFVYSLIALMLFSFITTLVKGSLGGNVIIMQIKTTEILFFCLIMLAIITTMHFSDKKTKKLKLIEHQTQPNKENVIEEDGTNKNAILREFKHIWLTSRPTTSLVPGITVFAILFLSESNSIFNSLLNCVVYIFITMFGFIINDIFDYKKDKLADRDRPIAKDLLPRNVAIRYAILILIFPIYIIYIQGISSLTLIAGGTIILLMAYSWLSKTYPLFKGLLTSLLCMSPIIYASTMSELTISYSVYISLFIFIFGRELFMDAQDLNGDMKSHLKTLPMYFGVDKSKFIAWTFMYFASFLLLFKTHSELSFFIVAIACINMIYAFFYSTNDENTAMDITKISMILCAISIPLNY